MHRARHQSQQLRIRPVIEVYEEAGKYRNVFPRNSRIRGHSNGVTRGCGARFAGVSVTGLRYQRARSWWSRGPSMVMGGMCSSTVNASHSSEPECT